MTALTVTPRCFYVYVLWREDGHTPFYVGKGKGRRWYNHEIYARSGTDNPIRDRIILAMQRKGLAVPKTKIMQGMSEELAYRLETHLIRTIGRFPNGPLTNLTDGGDGVRNLTAEARSRMGGWRGRPRSEETKEKLRAANLGKKHSAETRAKIGAISRSISDETKAKIGAASRNMSADARAKLSEAGRGRVKSAETRAKLSAAQTPERRARAAAVRTAANKARGCPPETRARLSEIGRNRSQEWRDKQSASKRGRKLSTEHRAKLSAARKARVLSPEQIAKTAAWHRGKTRGEIARNNIRAGIARRRKKTQDHL
jgi:hypothetical protein